MKRLPWFEKRESNEVLDTSGVTAGTGIEPTKKLSERSDITPECGVAHQRNIFRPISFYLA